MSAENDQGLPELIQQTGNLLTKDNDRLGRKPAWDLQQKECWQIFAVSNSVKTSLCVFVCMCENWSKFFKSKKISYFS